MSLWHLLAIYVVGALAASFYFGRQHGRTTDREVFVIIGWPLVACFVAIVAPFMFANWLGHRSRWW